jgi:hypothetical protein
MDRQDQLQVPSPLSGVFTSTVPQDLGCIQHALNAAAHPPRGLGELLPDGVQDLEHIRRCDLVNGLIRESFGVQA